MKVRDFLRTAAFAEWSDQWACDRLSTSLRATAAIIEKLVQLGYVELVSNPGSKEQYYKRTLAGSTLALASAARALSRASAEKHLAKFLDRVGAVNANPAFLYSVARAYVFGSFLTDATELSDVDVAVDVVPRDDDKSHHYEACNVRISEAIHAGRTFGNILDELSWPYTEVLLALKARSRAISLHTTDDAILETARKRLIYGIA